MKKIKFRPYDAWWIGVVLFGPAVAMWLFLIVFALIKGMFHCPLDWHGMRHVYLPFLAALVGLVIPLVCLRAFRGSRPRAWVPALVVYALVMLAWGIIDIRCENYQLGGHRYPNGPLVDGHKYYFHQYYTWYFLPYRLIEKGIDG